MAAGAPARWRAVRARRTSAPSYSLAMNAIIRVVIRAAAVVGAALTGWSNNVRWGSGPVRAGPPAQWERLAVGAALLAALAALAVWLGTRAGAGAGRTWLRAAACLFALGVAAIALTLRSRSQSLRLHDLIEGPGWTWMAAGAGVALAAAVGSFAVRGDLSRRSRARRRGAGPRAR
jgi:hypothetical protein